ncbi:MAG TPA: hypothetical protein G4N92_05535 [Anaerolineae bacterium]|nr:hypothetical protein [Anaerolineae bacterium]
MDTQTILSILGLLGIGGIVGSYIQYALNQKGDITKEVRILNEDKYRSILVFMRCILDPTAVNQFGFSNKDEVNLNKIKDDTEKIIAYAKSKLKEYYYHSFLYASDNVINEIENFIETPNEDNFIKTANAMRKDLWNKSKVEIQNKY